MTLSRLSTYEIVAALIRRGHEVLLVREQGPQDPEPVWGLPGGRVEPGELVHEALVREVREETGLAIADVGYLLYVTHHYNPGYAAFSEGELPPPGHRATAMIFAVAQWEGELSPADPDAFVQDASFFPIEAAIPLLERLPWRVMREPIVAYLRGEMAPGTVWCYRRQADGRDELVARLDGYPLAAKIVQVEGSVRAGEERENR